MGRRNVNPPGLVEPVQYTHVVAAPIRDLVFISGQVAYDANGAVVGKGNFDTQAQKAFENLNIALAAVDTTFANIVKMTTYIVDYKPEHRTILRRIRSEYLQGFEPPAVTLIGVQALANPDLLIEVDAIAMLNSVSK